MCRAAPRRRLPIHPFRAAGASGAAAAVGFYWKENRAPEASPLHRLSPLEVTDELTLLANSLKEFGFHPRLWSGRLLSLSGAPVPWGGRQFDEG